MLHLRWMLETAVLNSSEELILQKEILESSGVDTNVSTP